MSTPYPSLNQELSYSQVSVSIQEADYEFRQIYLPHSRKKIGLENIYFQKIDSTNSWLRRNAEFYEGKGICIIADRQLQGRGRLERKWVDVHGGLFFSFMTPEVDVSVSKFFTLWAGISVHRALNDIGTPGLSIKWPNDVHVHGKKVCGILCEMSNTLESNVPLSSQDMKKNEQKGFVIIGIGINLNNELRHFSDELQSTSTTILEITQQKNDPFAFANKIMNHFESMLNIAEKGEHWQFLKEWETSSSSVGRRISYSVGLSEEKHVAKIIGLNNEGWLRVIGSDSTEKVLSSGEVQFL